MHPLFKKLFIKYNTDLSSSTLIERLFNTGGLVLTNLRHHLTDGHIEQKLLLKFKDSAIQINYKLCGYQRPTNFFPLPPTHNSLLPPHYSNKQHNIKGMVRKNQLWRGADTPIYLILLYRSIALIKCGTLAFQK